MRDLVTAGLKSKSFAIITGNGWINLPEEVVEVESVREFQERLDSVWLSAVLTTCPPSRKGRVSRAFNIVRRRLSTRDNQIMPTVHRATAGYGQC